MVRYSQYKPRMVYLRTRLAAFIRQRRGDLSQREFARRVGVAQSTIMRIENQDQNVTLATLEQLCRAFRVDVEELFPVSAPPAGYPRDAVAPRVASVHEPEAGRTPARRVRRRRKPRV